MNKSFRQGQILQIIRNKEIYTQDELARELMQVGIQATQVTLSRDIRDLGLVKAADGYRQLPAEQGDPDLAGVANEYLQDIRVAQNIVVLKTSPGTRECLSGRSRSVGFIGSGWNNCGRRYGVGRHPR